MRGREDTENMKLAVETAYGDGTDKQEQYAVNYHRETASTSNTGSTKEREAMCETRDTGKLPGV